MSRIVVGVVLVVWGLGIIVSGLLREQHGGAYGAGQTLGWFFGVAMVALGARAIVKARGAHG